MAVQGAASSSSGAVQQGMPQYRTVHDDELSFDEALARAICQAEAVAVAGSKREEVQAAEVGPLAIMDAIQRPLPTSGSSGGSNQPKKLHRAASAPKVRGPTGSDIKMEETEDCKKKGEKWRRSARTTQKEPEKEKRGRERSRGGSRQKDFKGIGAE